MKRKSRSKLPAEAFDRVPRAQITLTAETCWLTRFGANGKPNTTYPVRAQDVARAFALFNASTGLLPPDVLFWTQVGKQTRLGIWLPPARRVLHFDLKRGEKLTVPLPGFVFVGQSNQYFIFAAAERPTSYGTALFHAPLPNVNGNGLICAGTVKFPLCAADTIHAAANLFFESAFNLDLSVGKFREINSVASGSLAETFAADGDYPGTTYDMDEYWEDEEERVDADDPRLMVADPDELGVRVRGERNRARQRRERTLFQFLRSLHKKDEFPLVQLAPSGETLQKIVEGN